VRSATVSAMAGIGREAEARGDFAFVRDAAAASRLSCGRSHTR
jgi:hypothetical protein